MSNTFNILDKELTRIKKGVIDTPVTTSVTPAEVTLFTYVFAPNEISNNAVICSQLSLVTTSILLTNRWRINAANGANVGTVAADTYIMDFLMIGNGASTKPSIMAVGNGRTFTNSRGSAYSINFSDGFTLTFNVASSGAHVTTLEQLILDVYV